MSYKAFMSYSHAADSRLAPKLQSALYGFIKPWYRLRSIRVFRDKTSLSATPGLWPAIEKALDESEYFLLLASPDAAVSTWVQKEIDHWQTHYPIDKFLIILTDGNIVWDGNINDFNWNKTDAIPLNLKNTFSQEPLFVDLRWANNEQHLSPNNPRFKDAVADIAATLHARPKDELVGEDVRQYSRTKRVIYMTVGILIILTSVALWQAQVAKTQTREATARHLAARAELMVSQRGILLETAGLLAVEAMRRSPSLEVDRAIRKVLGLLPKRVANIECAAVGEVANGVFSPDGNHLATQNNDDAIRIWDTNTGHLLSEVKAGGPITFSPTKPHVIFKQMNRTIIWDFEANREIDIIEHQGLRNIVYSKDGDFLVSVGYGKNTRIWDGTTYDLIASMENAQEMSFVAVAPGAVEWIVWNNNIAEIFRSPGRPEETLDLSAALGRVMFQYSAQGSFLSQVVPSMYQVQLFDTESHEKFLFEDRHWNAAFSRDGTVFAIASPEWDASVYDLRSCRQIGQYPVVINGMVERKYVQGRGNCRRIETVHHDNSINTVVLTSDGEYLGTTSRDSTARIWETHRGREVLRILERDAKPLEGLAFSADGHHVVGWGTHSCTTWESQGHRQVLAVKHLDAVQGVEFSSNGRFAMSISRAPFRNGDVHVWEVPSGKEVKVLPMNAVLENWSFGISPEGEKISVDGLEILGTTSGEKIKMLNWSEDTKIQTVSGDLQILARVTKDGDLVIIDTKNLKEIARHPSFGKNAESLKLSRNGRIVYLIVNGTELHLWNWQSTAEPISIFSNGRIRKASVDEIGNLSVVVNDKQNNVVNVYNIQKIKLIKQLKHEAEVMDISFDPSGQYLVTSSIDKVARVWEISTGLPIAQFEHDSDVMTAKFSPDGKYILSGGGRSDRTARLWLWHPEDLINETCSRLTRNLTKEEWQQYIATEAYHLTCKKLDER